MSRPESVSSSTQRRGSSSAICRISLRFFSPPEKPTLTRAAQHLHGRSSSLPAASRTRFMNSGVVSSASPRCLALRVERGAQERHGGDAGDFERILEGQEHALGGALVRLHLEHVLAVEQDLAFGDLVVGLAGEHIGERRLARAVRAHDGVHLALVHGEVEAVEDLLAVDSTCRFLISSRGIQSVLQILTLSSRPSEATTPRSRGWSSSNAGRIMDPGSRRCAARSG